MKRDGGLVEAMGGCRPPTPAPAGWVRPCTRTHTLSLSLTHTLFLSQTRLATCRSRAIESREEPAESERVCVREIVGVGVCACECETEGACECECERVCVCVCEEARNLSFEGNRFARRASRDGGDRASLSPASHTHSHTH